MLISLQIQPCLANEIMTPVGVVKVPCLPDSDTIVGLPTRQNANFAGAISANPDTATISGSAILSISGNPGFAINQFAGTHYVKFSNSSPAAPSDGQRFTISNNDANSLTVDLNGSSIDAMSGAELEILKFWTLNELFPPGECTTDAATTGNAIVAYQGGQNASFILYPDLTSDGIDLIANKIFYVQNGEWADFSTAPNAGDIQLWPDVYFTIQHSQHISEPTSYTSIGEIEFGDFNIPLRTLSDGQQDNHIAIPRPVDVTLDELNLGGTSAFVSSASELLADRKDELSVYDNTQAMINKLPSTIYYYHNGIWKKHGAGSTDFGTDIIPKAAGLVIRKAQTVDGATHIWKNTPSYTAP